MGVGDFLGKLFGAGSGDGGRPVDAVLRAYGKLPIYPEYRRLEVSPGLPTAFSQWLDAGRLAWMRTPARHDGRATHSSRLLLRLADSREVVVASLWDSRDSLGRIFPFTFFVTCPPESLGDTLIERWFAAAELHATFERYYGEIGTVAKGGDFYKFFQKRAVTLRSDLLGGRLAEAQRAAATINATDWVAAWSGSPEFDAALWFSGLLRRADRWRTQPAVLDELALSCPLAPSIPTLAQTYCWLKWLEPLLTKLNRPIGIVAPAGSSPAVPAALQLLVRPVLPDDFQILTSDEPIYGFVEHASGLPTLAPDAPPLAPLPAAPTSLLAWMAESAPKP